METIFQAPFIWIKAWNKNCGKTLTWHCCMCCNPTNGRVDFEEWSAYKNSATWYWMNCKLVSWLRPKSNNKKYLYSILLSNLNVLNLLILNCKTLSNEQTAHSSSCSKSHKTFKDFSFLLYLKKKTFCSIKFGNKIISLQLHGIEWIVSLSADWDQSPTKKKK